MKSLATTIALVMMGLWSPRTLQAHSIDVPGETRVLIADAVAEQEPPVYAKMITPASAVWWTERVPTTRGPVLPFLYVSLITLQVYDGYSTSRALQRGAVESNPLLTSVVTHPAAWWALKGATASTSIYFAERLWRQHRRGQAIATMMISNVVMAAVATNNARTLNRVK